MAIYNIFLVNVTMPDGRRALDIGQQEAVGFAISNFFVPVTQAATPKFDGAQQWWADCSNISTVASRILPFELLVYFLPSPMDTLLSSLDSLFKAGPDIGGQTTWPPAQTPTGSEVYTLGASTSDIAALALHEMMHNKLHMTDSQLHTIRGVGIGKATPASIATQKDIDLMAKALRTPRPQWTGGCTRSADPLRGILP